MNEVVVVEIVVDKVSISVEVLVVEIVSVSVVKNVDRVENVSVTVLSVVVTVV